MILLALLAIILPITLLAGFKLSARLGMTISVLAVGLVALLAWQIMPLAISASIAQGLHRALTIGLILFGAVTMLRTLQETGALTRIKLSLQKVSTDMRVQTVIVAFAFVSLIEGISGFGTPAIVAAPLLMVLGFRPIAAAALALLGDTVAVTFGAVGTPLLVGLSNLDNYSTDLVTLVGAQVTLFDLIIGTLLPLVLVALLIFAFSKQTIRQKWQSLIEILPYSSFIGLTYAFSAVVMVRLVGVEFTAIIAGAITLAVAIFTAKNNWLTPESVWRHHISESTKEEKIPQKIRHMPVWRAWLPYGLVIIILLLTRTVLPIKQFFVSAIDISWRNIFGLEGVSSELALLYSPGIILLIGAIFASLIGARSLKPLSRASLSSLKTTLSALSALIPTLIMVQIFTNSGINTSGLVAMPIYIGHCLADVFGELWLAVAPILGMIGAFIAGSSTVSTLTMAPVQVSIATSVDLPTITVLALQMIGAAAGNIIAIHNVVAASVVVGLSHREGYIIRRLIIPTIGYVLVACLIGLVIALTN